MKILFRKHGNSFFYIFLPVFLFILTIAFIQLTPRTSRTAGGDVCDNPEDCCTTSGCGDETSETCTDGTCILTNLGCTTGTVTGTSAEDCTCVTNGQVVGECVVCPVGEIFENGLCLLITDTLEGASAGCALNSSASLPASPGFYLVGLGLLFSACFMARRKSR